MSRFFKIHFLGTFNFKGLFLQFKRNRIPTNYFPIIAYRIWKIQNSYGSAGYTFSAYITNVNDKPICLADDLFCPVYYKDHKETLT